MKFPMQLSSEYIGVPVIGVDEVGRGCVFGPLITCAVFFPSSGPPAALLPLLGDSKALSGLKRQKAVQAMHEYGIIHAFGAASVREIDKLNVFQATMLAMKRAVDRLQREGIVMVDGPYLPPLGHLRGLAVIKGDTLIPAIMAASILAKEFRDSMIRKLGSKYPAYGLDSHVGYGTSRHMQAIRNIGICRHHRLSFLKNVMNS